ncbi:MAG: hypothetical protein RIR52_442, partial [Acidobacteriota bacterium]
MDPLDGVTSDEQPGEFNRIKLGQKRRHNGGRWAVEITSRTGYTASSIKAAETGIDLAASRFGENQYRAGAPQRAGLQLEPVDTAEWTATGSRKTSEGRYSDPQSGKTARAGDDCEEIDLVDGQGGLFKEQIQV